MVERRIGMMKQHQTFTIDEFRALLGVPEAKLERFADLNKYCLKPALTEVNQLTDFIVQIGATRTAAKEMSSWRRSRIFGQLRRQV
jgi:plasmid replication initiation protein